MNSALKITSIYMIFALVWILVSDRLISLMTDSVEILTFYSHIKGGIFIIITGILLYTLIQRRITEKNRIISELDREVLIKEQLINELHHRIKNNMQVIISLIHLEAGNIPGLKELNERITNKLLSMISIFNIVYDLKDMKKISLAMVIEEYVRISYRNLEYKMTEVYEEFSIELITSLMLVIDSIIEIYLPQTSSRGKVVISLSGPGTLMLHFPEVREASEIREEDKDFIKLQLLAISGSMQIGTSEKKMFLSFDSTI